MMNTARSLGMGRFKVDGLTPANQSEFTSAFESYKNRPEPEIGQRVKVYRNLNVAGYYSICMAEGELKGKVVGYGPAVGITDVKLKVSTKARDSIITKGHRNVHAWALGFYAGCSDHPPLTYRKALKITYMPFVRAHFFARTNPSKPVTRLTKAWAYDRDIHTLEL